MSSYFSATEQLLLDDAGGMRLLSDHEPGFTIPQVSKTKEGQALTGSTKPPDGEEYAGSNAGSDDCCCDNDDINEEGGEGGRGQGRGQEGSKISPNIAEDDSESDNNAGSCEVLLPTLLDGMPEAMLGIKN